MGTTYCQRDNEIRKIFLKVRGLDKWDPGEAALCVPYKWTALDTYLAVMAEVPCWD